MQIDIDNWTRNINNSESFPIQKSDIQLVEQKFDLLNQKTHTQLTIGSKNNYLIVGGGNGAYVVTFSDANNEFSFTLSNGSKENTEIEVVTGGQLGSFPQNIVVSKEVAWDAIRYYVENEEMISTYRWEED